MLPAMREFGQLGQEFLAAVQQSFDSRHGWRSPEYSHPCGVNEIDSLPSLQRWTPSFAPGPHPAAG